MNPNTLTDIFKGDKIKTFLLIVFTILLLSKSIIVIPAGQTGIYHLFGKVSDKELPSGLHVINPFASITPMSIRTEEYTMSVTYGEGKRTQADAITALTKEGLAVDMDITVLYRLNQDQAAEVFRTIGLNYEEKIIRPEIRSTIREITAQYEAKDIYSEKREEAANKILANLQTNLKDRGVIVENVLLRNVQLPANLAESIQKKLQAEQEAQQMEFVLEKEKKEAERKRIEASGQRDAQKTINESLTNKYLEYLYINSLKDRKGTVYIPVDPNNGLPLFRNLP